MKTIQIKLPGLTDFVVIPFYTPEFEPWTLHYRPKIWNNKDVILLKNRASVGELGWAEWLKPQWYAAWVYKPKWISKRSQHVLACSAIEGGVWTYQTKYKGVNELKKPSYVPCELPENVIRLIGQIYSKANLNSGCWDVVAWKGQEVRFYECKQPGKDGLKPSQLSFLDAALCLGMPAASFGLVEWKFRQSGLR